MLFIGNIMSVVPYNTPMHVQSCVHYLKKMTMFAAVAYHHILGPPAEIFVGQNLGPSMQPPIFTHSFFDGNVDQLWKGSLSDGRKLGSKKVLGHSPNHQKVLWL
jgi:hypothetical protein